MKDIYICTNEFPTEENFDGGIANHFFRLAKVLKTKSYNPIIVTSSKNDNEIYYKGIKVIRVKVFNIIVRIILMITQKFGFKGEIYPRPFFSVYQSYLLNRELKKRVKNNEIIIYSSYQYLNLFQKKIFKSLVVIWSLQKDWNFINRENFLQKIDSFLEDKSFLYANNIISVSKLLFNKIDTSYQSKTSIIFPTFAKEEIDTKSFKEVQKIYGIDYKYILYFGSLIERKGIFLLSKVIKNICKQDKKIHFLFIGSDSMQKFKSAKNKILMENKDLKNKIHFLNPIKHEFLYPIIQNAKMVVMPTFIDTAPSASLETMHAGGLFLGSDNSSLEEYIEDGQNGFLFKNGDIFDLEKKILNISKLPDIETQKIKIKIKEDLKCIFSEKNTDLFIKKIQKLDSA
jgi:glycogen synthase